MSDIAVQPAVLHRVPGTGTPIAALAIGTHVISMRKSPAPGSPTEVAGDSLRWGFQGTMYSLSKFRMELFMIHLWGCTH